MDPFSADSELINLQSAFYSGQYDSVLTHNTSSFSPSTQPLARIYTLRARIALGQSRDIVSELSKEKTPALQAVKALAEYSAGKQTTAIKTIEKLMESESDSEDASVQILGAIVLQNEGRTEEALALLGKHSGNLEAMALLIQIHLQQNRIDLAQKEFAAARRMAQDDVLVQIAESWIGMRVGGDKYQSAFYVFEELAQASATSAPLNLVSQAVAELHLNRYEEARSALMQALEKDPSNEDALANLHVLNLFTNNKDTQYLETLRETNDGHALITGINEKSDLFDIAAEKFATAA